MTSLWSGNTEFCKNISIPIPFTSQSRNPLTPMPTTKSNLSNLQNTLPLLHLLYRRNKNQHRSSTWFKWLSILRRNLTHLLTELSSSSDGGDSQQYQNKPATDRTAVRATAREAHLVNHVLGKCYLYVSHLR